MSKNKLKSIDVSKYTVTDTGQVLKMNKEVEVIQRPTYEELDKYKEMVEDMKGDMCGTSDITLCNYLIAILKKYGEIV